MHGVDQYTDLIITGNVIDRSLSRFDWQKLQPSNHNGGVSQSKSYAAGKTQLDDDVQWSARGAAAGNNLDTEEEEVHRPLMLSPSEASCCRY